MLNASPSHGTYQITGFKMIKNFEACSCFFKNMQAETIMVCPCKESHNRECSCLYFTLCKYCQEKHLGVILANLAELV